MPSQATSALAAAAQEQPMNIVVTNESLIKSHEQGFVLAGNCFADGGYVPKKDGVVDEEGQAIGNQYAFDLPANGQAVILSQSLKETFEQGNGHTAVSYLSRGEVQGDVKLKEGEAALAAQYRLIRIMPVLTIKQDGREMMHLTLRGLGASDAGNWGCASSLLSTQIDPRSIYATLNRETGLLIDGEIAIFEPAGCQDNSMNAAIKQDAIRIKLGHSKTSPELKAAFARGAERVLIPTKIELPARHDNVYFYGGVMNKEIPCIAHDNAEQRTLTMIFPMVVELPKGAVLTAFNGQGYDEPAALVDTQPLKKQSVVTLIPGLKEYLLR